MCKDVNFCQKNENVILGRQMGTGLLGGRSCNKGGRGYRLLWEGWDLSEDLKVARMLAQLISEKSPPGRKDCFTGQGMGGGMTGICFENLKEALAAEGGG